jgi:hypothetical protein
MGFEMPWNRKKEPVKVDAIDVLGLGTLAGVAAAGVYGLATTHEGIPETPTPTEAVAEAPEVSMNTPEMSIGKYDGELTPVITMHPSVPIPAGEPDHLHPEE